MPAVAAPPADSSDRPASAAEAAWPNAPDTPRPRPQVSLRCQVASEPEGRWLFELRDADGDIWLSAEDIEPERRGEELELLTIVRGLESLDQPADVTLVGSSRYIQHGLRFGLPEWRRNNWRWEWYGLMVPVRHAELWQRLDRALQFHRLKCGSLAASRHWRIDRPHNALGKPKSAQRGRIGAWGVRGECAGLLECGVADRLYGWLRRIVGKTRDWLRPLVVSDGASALGRIGST